MFNFSEDINSYIDNNKNRLKLNKKGNPLFVSANLLALEFLEQTHTYIQSLRILFNYNPASFASHFNEINIKKCDELDSLPTKELKLGLIKNKLHYCKQCGKPTLNDEYCSIKCVSNSKCVQDKRKETNLERYGATTPAGNKDIQQKIENTKEKLYGDKYFTNSNKRKETNLERYGFENPAQNLNVIFKIKQSRHNISENTTFDEFEKLNSCINRKFIIENFVENNLFLFNDFITFFNVSSTTGLTIKRKLGITIENKHSTTSNKEKELFETINCEKILNCRTIIYPLELDAFIPKFNLALEYDGLYWHSIKFKDKNYHLQKTLKCEKAGIRLFHIFENDNVNIWKSKINTIIHKSSKIYARQTKIAYISFKQAKRFIQNNSLDRFIKSKYYIGLMYQNECVMIMSFDKHRINNICSKQNLCVVGGFSKILNFYMKNYCINNDIITTIINLRYDSDKTLTKLGFVCTRTIEPQINSIQFMNQYYKIYDCGYKEYSYIVKNDH